MYRQYGEVTEENREALEFLDNERNYFYAPSPYGWRPDIPMPAPVDQTASPYICSCDALSAPYDPTSEVYFYDDRCADYETFCGLELAEEIL